jgi:hypothetical protein
MRPHAAFDQLDILRLDTVGLHERLHPFHGAEGRCAYRMRFQVDASAEGFLEDSPRRAEVADLGEIVSVRDEPQEPDLALERTPGTRETAFGEQCRSNTDLIGAPCMERLAVRAELFLKAARFGRCDTERVRRLLLRQPQEFCGRRRGAERADRAGGMPSLAIVVPAVDQRFAELPLHFGAEHVSRDDVAPAGAEFLGERENRRHDDDGTVADEDLVGIVEVEDVAEHPVRERRVGD